MNLYEFTLIKNFSGKSYFYENNTLFSVASSNSKKRSCIIVKQLKTFIFDLNM